ncbi:MAG: FAD-binding oxidoreductase [Methylomonas sp.]|jgi:glycine/D-amino acid oxidase-like deaminating enzyme|uniref:NAD(P)/FAD-dependent oxidoreductase n=1 Tax=Methylomonas sp. TaxID=418 RepID=UPI0025E24640|nr:FAD-dependent oxidoreductase [Methylomonas sp.]MCK9606813.1 FAD-binding oxidoreductase [Methylomonas sp.]
MPIDVLIVGQGLAGSLLAWELIRQEMRVIVIDNGRENASQVAAGLINPVTGQRLVKNSDVLDLLPAAMQCYRVLSEVFQQHFFVALPMLRILNNVREQRAAEQRLNQPDYQAFLAAYPDATDAIKAPYGVLRQAQTGYLKTGLLLAHLRNFLIAKASYRQADFNYNELILHPNLSWREFSPKHIVFCEGHHANQNPWFGGLPFQPAKGEILRCRSAAKRPEQIINYGHWMIPMDAQQFKLGATFQPGQTDTRPTELAKHTLLQGIAGIMPGLMPIVVTAQHVGVRPTTLDKQPFIGSHPQYANLHIFNGFGAKGSLAIPWHAKQFVAALQKHALLPIAVNIQRYYETHFLR